MTTPFTLTAATYNSKLLDEFINEWILEDIVIITSDNPSESKVPRMLFTNYILGKMANIVSYRRNGEYLDPQILLDRLNSIKQEVLEQSPRLYSLLLEMRLGG